MPTYEYRCRACGHRFERFQKITAKPVKECPECGEKEAERLISPGAGIVFKGPGFYATDYRKPAPGEKKGEGKGEQASEGKGEGAKAEGKKESGKEGAKED